MSQLRTDIEQIFRDVFGDPQFVLRDDMTAADVDGWDSLTHLNLIIAMKKRLGIRFASAEISRLKDDGQNIGSLLELVNRKRSA